jgi:hypothetical protein
VACALTSAAGTALAQPPGYPPPSSPYGDAGCGLGSMVIGSGSGFSQVFAATTNDTSYSQTFGITSGTSNCVDVAPGYASARSFSETNRTAMSKDIARGQGETIATLTTLGGCNKASSVGASLQKSYRRIVPDAAVSDRAFGKNVIDTLAADRSLGCKKLAPVARR